MRTVIVGLLLAGTYTVWFPYVKRFVSGSAGEITKSIRNSFRNLDLGHLNLSSLGIKV